MQGCLCIDSCCAISSHSSATDTIGLCQSRQLKAWTLFRSFTFGATMIMRQVTRNRWAPFSWLSARLYMKGRCYCEVHWSLQHLLALIRAWLTGVAELAPHFAQLRPSRMRLSLLSECRSQLFSFPQLRRTDSFMLPPFQTFRQLIILIS